MTIISQKSESGKQSETVVGVLHSSENSKYKI